MSEEEGTQSVVRTENPGIYGEQSRSVQEFRLDFRPEIKELRILLTGKRYANGGVEKLHPGMICDKHFAELLPLVHLPNTKAWTLSRIHESKAEIYVISIMDTIDRWIHSRCMNCDDCGIQGSYTNKSNVMIMLEAFFYGNMNRSVGGFEAELLGQMQQVTSREDYLKSDPRKGAGLMGGLRNMFRGR